MKNNKTKIQFVHKVINYGDFSLHHIFYKNINLANYNVLCDQLSELLYNESISLTGNTIAADLKLFKNCLKAEKQTFGEVNWPVNWLHNKNNEQYISGYYSGISGSTVKTIAANGFIAKIIETTDARFCFAGEIYHTDKKLDAKKQYNALFENIQKTLLTTGLTSEHIKQLWFYINPNNDAKTQFNKLCSEYLQAKHINAIQSQINSGNQHKSAVQSSFIAINRSNNIINFNDTALENAFVFKNTKLQCLSIASFNAATNGDINNQLNNTVEKIQQLLESNTFSWKQIVRAIAYFKDINDAKLFKQLCKNNGIPLSPILITESGFLNNNQLFSFEADFVKQNN